MLCYGGRRFEMRPGEDFIELRSMFDDFGKKSAVGGLILPDAASPSHKTPGRVLSHGAMLAFQEEKRSV